jgi:L-serine dehydratase
MRASGDFVAELNREGLLEGFTRVQAELYGSLALTGKCHGTDRAILLGLSGEAPDKVDPESIEPKLAAMAERIFEATPQLLRLRDDPEHIL